MTPYGRYNHHKPRSEKLARKTPSPYKIPPVNATIRGPLRVSQRPPKNADMPSTKMLIVNVNVTSGMLHPNCFASGVRKTLQAYTAPNAICKKTPAVAMTQRFILRIVPPRTCLLARLGMCFREKFLPPRLEQSIHCDKSATQILAPKLIQNCQQAGRLFPLLPGVMHRLGKRQRKSVEHIRIELSEHFKYTYEIPCGAHGFWRSRRVDDPLQCFVTGSKQPTQYFQHAAVVQSLQYFVRGNQRVRVFARRSF